MPGQSIQFSVRPEAIRLERDGDGTGRRGNERAKLRGTVEQVAYLGSAVQYHIRTEGGLGVSVLASRTGPRFESGDIVDLAWSPTDALILGDRPAEVEESS